jgi:hypothetical protein
VAPSLATNRSRFPKDAAAVRNNQNGAANGKDVGGTLEPGQSVREADHYLAGKSESRSEQSGFLK